MKNLVRFMFGVTTKVYTWRGVNQTRGKALHWMQVSATWWYASNFKAVSMLRLLSFHTSAQHYLGITIHVLMLFLPHVALAPQAKE